MANMPLTDIGITPRKASQFASKGIETVTDLLGYYPTKYLDFRNPISFAEGKYHQGEHVAIKGKVVSGRVIDGKHYMLRLTDGNTFCTVFWFNQPFRTRQFSVGDVIALGGVVSWNEQYNNMTMATPDFVTTDIASAFSIQPVYRKIKGMSVEYLEDAIKLALPYTRECSAETLSLAQMRALRVPPLAEAIHMAHQPTDEKEIRLSRKRRAVDVLYPFCYELEAKKAEAAKVSFCRIKSTRDVLNKMQGVLPFKLTEDQKNAAEHMLTEMEHGERVDTLVQGDVGCGKTVVAEICALAMAMNGFQCAVMAPTVVLATQHYEEFSKILGSFGYKTVFLRSGMKAKEEKSVLEEIESGKAQIIVGTHSVISGKVKYHKLGLTIVDEEHRFGVEQREALKQKAKDGVHNVSMSATPIPRSLANTLYGEGTEIVNIHTMPAGRKPVKTIIWSNENSCYKSVYKYSVSLDVSSWKVVADTLDTYSRILMGQFGVIYEALDISGNDEQHFQAYHDARWNGVGVLEARDLLIPQLKKIGVGWNGNFGISNSGLAYNSKLAYEILKTIRYATEKRDSSVLKVTDEPLPRAEGSFPIRAL